MNFPFDSSDGLVVVPVTVFGPGGKAVLRLALDTGATGTLINTGMLVALGYDPTSSTERTQITTGSGVEFVAQVTLHRVRALGQSRNKMIVLAHTLPPSANIDGLLGLDFLYRRKLIIDFRTERIEVL